MNRIRMAQIGLVAASLMATLPTAVQAEEGELFKNMLSSMGVIPDDKPGIDYRERAPLVLPPRMELREPVAPGSVRAGNPQWPRDPDVVARERREADDNGPAGQNDTNRNARAEGVLSAREMRAGRVAGANVQTTVAPAKRGENASWVNPDVLRAQNPQRRGMAADDGQRRSLTDPPSAYRKSATGQSIVSSFDAPVRENTADPKSFIREQALKRQGVE